MDVKVAEFMKVSFDKFDEALANGYANEPCLYIDSIDVDIRTVYDKIKTPTRATTGSAGYDFYLPYDVKLYPGCTAKIPTGIRVRIDDGWWLACMPKSGLGCKYRLQLDNTIGVIDSDYFYSDNEGHIFAQITNDSKNTMSLKAGDKFMQGVFIPFGITYNDNAVGKRNGGFGSTGK